MRPLCSFVFGVSILVGSFPVSAEDVFQPLDTRTRCIVLFRECLVRIEQKDIDGIFEIVADGKAQSFRLYPNSESLLSELRQERSDVDRFIERNFRSASLLNESFRELEFSELTTTKKMVSLMDNANSNKKVDAKLHSLKIKVKIPDKDRHETAELRFLEVAEELYWIPIGW